MVQMKKYAEKAFWLLLLISPALDMINGIWTYLICGGDGGMLSSLDIKNIPGMSPSFLIRIGFLLIMVAYLFLQKKWKAIAMFVVIGLCWIGTVAGEFIRGVEFSLMADIQYITRFCYCLVVLIAYSTMMKQDQRKPEDLRNFVDKVLCGSLTVLGLGVLIPFILGIGFYTYADPLGYRGSRGFFYAGNDITAVMMLMLPVVLVGWMEQKNVKKAGYPWLQAVSAALGLMSMLIIGTKTSFLAAGVTLIAMGGYGVIVGLKKKDWQGSGCWWYWRWCWSFYWCCWWWLSPARWRPSGARCRLPVSIWRSPIPKRWCCPAEPPSWIWPLPTLRRACPSPDW